MAAARQRPQQARPLPPRPHDAEPLVRRPRPPVRFVVRDADRAGGERRVDFDLAAGETLCILGESGSGKIRHAARADAAELRRSAPDRRAPSASAATTWSPPRSAACADIRGRVVSMIFQEPMTALDPVFTIGSRSARRSCGTSAWAAREADRRALELLELVQIPSAKRRLDAYPHELSGGLRQRAMIAIALSCRPKLLLADEPTTALDATVQIQILLLLRKLQRELGMGTDLRHPRPRRRRRGRRPGRGDVRRPLCRNRSHRQADRWAGASLHQRPAAINGPSGLAWRAACADRWRPSGVGRPANGLQLPPAAHARWKPARASSRRWRRWRSAAPCAAATRSFTINELLADFLLGSFNPTATRQCREWLYQARATSARLEQSG